MRRFSIRLLLTLTALITAALACVLPGGSATPAPNIALTAAAQTLSALATAMVATNTPTPELPAPAELTPTPTDPTEAPVDPSPAVLSILYKDTSQNLWIWTEGSAPLQLTSSGDVESAIVSPDGSMAVFTRSVSYTSFSLWVIGVDGGSERELLSSADLNSMGMVDGAVDVMPDQIVWVPGARQLAISTRPLFEGPGLARNEDLYFIDVDSASVTQIFERGAGGIYSLSPDGRRMTISRTDRVDLANLDGSGRLVGLVTYTPVLTYSEYAFYAVPVWASDSSRAVVAIPPSASLDANGPTTLWQINADGSTVALRSLETAPLAWPALSPDLAQAAYLTAGDPMNLMLVQSSGDLGGLSLPSVQRFLGWASDSLHFAYQDYASAVYTAGLADGPVLLAGTESVLDLTWLPDGRAAFFARAGDNWELRLTRPGESGLVIAVLPPGVALPSLNVP